MRHRIHAEEAVICDRIVCINYVEDLVAVNIQEQTHAGGHIDCAGLDAMTDIRCIEFVFHIAVNRVIALDRTDQHRAVPVYPFLKLNGILLEDNVVHRAQHIIGVLHPQSIPRPVVAVQNRLHIKFQNGIVGNAVANIGAETLGRRKERTAVFSLGRLLCPVAACGDGRVQRRFRTDQRAIRRYIAGDGDRPRDGICAVSKRIDNGRCEVLAAAGGLVAGEAGSHREITGKRCAVSAFRHENICGMRQLVILRVADLTRNCKCKQAGWFFKVVCLAVRILHQCHIVLLCNTHADTVFHAWIC